LLLVLDLEFIEFVLQLLDFDIKSSDLFLGLVVLVCHILEVGFELIVFDFESLAFGLPFLAALLFLLELEFPVVDAVLILLVVRFGLFELNLKSGVLNLQLQSDLLFGFVLGFP
jgi:hypothetical protein